MYFLYIELLQKWEYSEAVKKKWNVTKLDERQPFIAVLVYNRIFYNDYDGCEDVDVKRLNVV